MAKVQGNGLSLVFATSGWLPKITSFAKTESADDIETSDLSTTGMKTYAGGALVEGGTYTFGFHYDPVLTTRPTTGTSETITVNYPVSVSGNTAQNDAFTGDVNIFDLETEKNKLVEGTFVLKVADDITETPEA